MKRNVGVFRRDRQLEFMFLMDRPRFDADPDPEPTLYFDTARSDQDPTLKLG
jgi:hypothetical protein